MPEDQVVAEVRARRAQLLEEAGGSVAKLVEFLRQREADAGRTPVTNPPRPPVPQTRAG